MKRVIVVVISIVIVLLVIIYMNYKNKLILLNDSINFNKDYEFYTDVDILGADITTLINKATNNNESEGIPKDENGMYILDDEKSIEIYVYMSSTDTTYPMEAFNKIGLEDFIKYFGQVKFKCTKIEYHDKTGRVSKMVFESEEY